MRIDGAGIAAGIVARLRQMPVPERRLVAVLVRGNAAAASFVARKAALAKTLGVAFETISFSGAESQDAVLRAIGSLAADASVGGIVLQLPLPSGYDRAVLVGAIGAAKDVDNLSARASVMPPSVGAAVAVLAAYGRKFSDYGAVRIIGNGFLVGAPIARFCAAHGIAHAVADIGTADLAGFVRDADLVVTGVGNAGLVDPAWIPDGAGVMDFGFPPDFDQKRLTEQGGRFAFYTPTPSGTGPVLVATLFENFYSLNAEG